MPRSIQEILDHADELAQRFENLDPDVATEVPVEEYLLQRAVVTRARSEQQLLDAVAQARAKGLSWQKIGSLIGTSAQAAQHSSHSDTSRTKRSGYPDMTHLTTDANETPIATPMQLATMSAGSAAPSINHR